MENFGSTCLDFIPHKTIGKKETKKNHIFVSVASYRDDECNETIKSIYKNAKDPEKVVVGICQQNKEDCEKCDKDMDPLWNIKTVDFDYMEAKGPTYARYWCSTLWDGEEYFFQIDSHTKFQPNWDKNLISMWEQAHGECAKPILSAYPPTEKQVETPGFPIMCNGKIGENKIPIFLAGWHGESPKPVESPKPFCAGGFMFLRGDFLYEVPYDPNLSHLFQGEETLLSARLFTHGYDVWAPNIKVASHHYGRKEKPKYWVDHKNSGECRKMAEKRVLFLLGRDHEKISKDFLRNTHNYGMGKERDLKMFFKKSGIDFDKKTVTKDC